MDLNRGPTDYESVALPLSYAGLMFLRIWLTTFYYHFFLGSSIFERPRFFSCIHHRIFEEFLPLKRDFLASPSRVTISLLQSSSVRFPLGDLLSLLLHLDPCGSSWGPWAICSESSVPSPPDQVVDPFKGISLSAHFSNLGPP